ncbi:RNA methylase [Tenacibaculum xiamenense]|uniref:RNA methylase n=1 Tax=Tenacibaculum xiamenense TaxID=1261553 RepID=UPI0038939F34
MTKNWNQLYTLSKELTKPASVDNIFSNEDVNYLQQELKNVINKFLDRGELHKGIKIYINQELNNAKVYEMVENRPEKDKTIEDWCNQLFGNDKFGVVFNSLEAYSNDLTEKMCNIVAPLLEKAGLPLGGLSFLFFMGNYGFTPFGIHKEAKGEEGFLFHLGPNNKDFYTWDIEEYNKIEHNTQVFHDIEKFLPQSKKYPLKAKSVMFIPHHVYHIANTNEFSLSVVMDYINPSRDYLENKMAGQIAETNSIEKNQGYLAPIKSDVSLDWNFLLNKTTWEEKYKKELNKFITKLKSNAGVLQSSLIKNNALPNPPFNIRAKTIFPILLNDQESESCIIARGHELKIKKNISIEEVLKKLNNGETISFQELETSFSPDWDLGYVFQFVNELLMVEAINIV